MSQLHLMSHSLCPYVQRAVILLYEKNIPFERTVIDLAHKPEWFLKISPLGKVPVLKIDDDVLFESAAICEYLDETHGIPLHPSQPLPKARHRSWMEFSSVLQTALWQLLLAPSETELEQHRSEVEKLCATIELELREGPFFAGREFSMVDAFFAPAFRYFDFIEMVRDLKLFAERPRLAAWRRNLAARLSVQRAVEFDYAEKLGEYVAEKSGILAQSWSR